MQGMTLVCNNMVDCYILNAQHKQTMQAIRLQYKLNSGSPI